MCWNAEVSLQSFLIGITAIGIAYQKGLSLPRAIFFLTITLMQLVEYFVWTSYDNPQRNFQLSLLAFGLLCIQPITSMLILPSNLFQTLILFYSGLLVAYFLIPEPQSLEETFRMRRGENGHLVWHWLDKRLKTTLLLIVYFFFLLAPLIYMKEFVGLSIVLITLAVSLFSYYNYNTWGSMWCWIVNYLVVGLCGYQVLVAKP